MDKLDRIQEIFSRRRASRLFTLLIFGWLAACTPFENIRSSSAPNKALAAPITAMSFNIRLGIGQEDPNGKISKMPWGRNLPAVVAAIRASGADIVALQEVAGIAQIRSIAKALNMNFAFEWHQTGSASAPWWGVGILSTYPILGARGVQISSGPGNTRSIVIASIGTHQGRISVFSIHKDKDLKDGQSVRNILAAASSEADPILLIGDFNIRPEDKRLADVLKKFTDTATAVSSAAAARAIERGTFYPSRKRIDYIFAETRAFEVVHAGLVDESHWLASDHIGYVARLNLRHRANK